MKVIRALTELYIPSSPEDTREEYLVLTRVNRGNLALVSDSYLSRISPRSYEVYANVNPKFSRDKNSRKKAVNNVNVDN